MSWSLIDQKSRPEHQRAKSHASQTGCPPPPPPAPGAAPPRGARRERRRRDRGRAGLRILPAVAERSATKQPEHAETEHHQQRERKAESSQHGRPSWDDRKSVV